MAANNHYAGFGPGTVNIFRQLIGLVEVKCGDEYISNDLEKDDDPNMNKRVIRIKQPVCLTFSNKYNEDIGTLRDEGICRYLFIDILKFQLFFVIMYDKT